MRIAMITADKFPPDIRIEKEAFSLSKYGHDVFVCTPTGQLPRNTWSGLAVEIGERLSLVSAAVGRLNRVIRSIKPDVIHIQDTPAALPGIVVGKMMRLPVILDVHEPWPFLVIENSPSLSYRDKLWSANLAASEATAFLGADRIFTVVREASGYFSEKYPFKVGMISEINNFEDRERLRTIRANTSFREKEYVVCYVGGVDGPIRGLEDVIHAFSLLKGEDVSCVIVGDGWYLPYLRRLASASNLTHQVEFIGQKRFEEAMSIAAASDICILPHKHCFTTAHTLPHKISQYMALERPVVSANLAPIKRLFNGCYIEWEPRVPVVLANLLLRARDNAVENRTLLRKAIERIDTHCNWEREGRRLVKIYEEIERHPAY